MKTAISEHDRWLIKIIEWARKQNKKVEDLSKREILDALKAK